MCGGGVGDRGDRGGVGDRRDRGDSGDSGDSGEVERWTEESERKPLLARTFSPSRFRSRGIESRDADNADVTAVTVIR